MASKMKEDEKKDITELQQEVQRSGITSYNCSGNFLLLYTKIPKGKNQSTEMRG